jgi:hypothetical protein
MLQRQCACGQHRVGGGECEECKQKNKRTLQRRSTEAAEPVRVPPLVHEVLRSPGQPLHTAVRSFMEPRFSHNFSQVRVHTDDKAAESARQVKALAYTVGRDVVFGTGQYAPGTAQGKRVIAHELVHVLQQSGTSGATGRPQPLSLAPGSDPLEREAEAHADRILAGAPSSVPAHAPSGLLQRQTGGSASGSSSSSPGPRETHTPITTPAAQDLALPRTRSTANYGLGVFESELRTFGEMGTPCLLTLRLNLHFDFVDSPPPAQPGAAYTPTRTLWSASEQTQWISSFIRGVTSRWSYRYPLVSTTPDCLWSMALCNRAMARVEVIPVTSGADAEVRVAHVPASQYRSNAGYGQANLTQEDILQGAHVGSQVTVAHEFGHLLGLDHSNPGCQSTASGPAPNPGRDECYGVTPGQIADIMGQGSIVTPQDYAPFVAEMNYYTDPCNWQTEGSAPTPPRESFLAGHAGLATGMLVGTVGGAIAGGVLGSGGPLGAGGGAVLGGLVGLGGGMILGALADWIAS